MKKIILFYIIGLLSLNSTAQIGLSFNGTNSVTSNAFPVLNNQSRTVDAWIKTTSTLTTQMVICDWGVITPNASRFTMNVLNNRLRIEIGGVGITGTTVVNTGNWVHVSAVYESSITTGNNVFVYVNGLLDATGTFTGYPVLSTANTVGFRLGVRVDNANFFTGAMDEVKVYNYARTQAQIAADTVEYCSPQPGLVLYYKLNEGTPNSTNTGSTTCVDYSGNNNNGTLSANFALTGTVSNWVPGRVRTNAPVINAGSSLSICNGGSVSLSANAASGTYTWSTGNTTSTIITVNPTSSTVYSISVTTTQNCVASSSIAVTVFQAVPQVTVTAQQNPICFGASTSFSAVGASTYVWSGGISNNTVFTPTTTSTFTLNASNACGQVNSVHTITVNLVPVQITSSSNSVCVGSNATLTASSTMPNYTWAPSVLIGSVALVSPSIATIYSVTASNGTCIGTQTIQLNTLPSPSLSISSTTAVPAIVYLCGGQSYTAAATSTNTSLLYNWLPAGGSNSTAVLSPSISSIYTVVGTAANGCSGSASLVVIVQPSPTLTLASNRNLVCPNGTATIVYSGVGTVTWSTGSTASSIIVTPVAPFSIYTATMSSLNNTCTTTNSIQISVITPSVNYTSTLNVCTNSSGTLTASGAGTYSWNGIFAGSAGSIVITPTANSIYTLTALTFSQSQVCTSTYYSSVSLIPSPTLAVSGTTIWCKNGEAPVVATVSGAQTYTWINTSTVGNTLSPTPQTSTNYTVIGTAANSCTAAASFSLRVVLCPGFAEYSGDAALTVFPNPASEKLNISSPIETQIQLYSIDGKLVAAFEVRMGENQFDISRFNAGIYFFKCMHNPEIITQKIMLR